MFMMAPFFQDPICMTQLLFLTLVTEGSRGELADAEKIRAELTGVINHGSELYPINLTVC